MKRVAVIGAGTMGNGIAHVFAQSGHTVTLVDVHAAALERAQATLTATWTGWWPRSASPLRTRPPRWRA